MSEMDSALPAAAANGFRRVTGAIGLAGLVALAVVAAASRFLAPFPSGALNVGASLAYPSAAHPFGTDLLGRDVWSETLHGLAITMGNAGVGFAVALVAGSFAGFLVAHALGRASIVTRIVAGVLVAVPSLLLAILFAALLGHANAAIAVGLAAAPAAFARAHDRVRTGVASPHVNFARATGMGQFALFRRDLVCELREQLVATAARALAAVTITFATMSFFGFGAVPPARDLGLMIAAARETLPAAWWTAVFPVAALALTILAARLAAGLSGGERP